MKRLNTRLLGYIFLATATVLGCSDLLGLNTDRQLDDSYPSDGYDGCRPGESCGECTSDAHLCLCEERPECTGEGGGGNSGGTGGSSGASGRGGSSGSGGSAAGSSGRNNGGGGTGQSGAGQSGGGAGGAVTVDECASESGCLECTTSCLDGCICAGGTQTDCQTQCTGYTPRDPTESTFAFNPPTNCDTLVCYYLLSPSGFGYEFPACCTDTDVCGYDHEPWNPTPRSDGTTCYPAYEPGAVTTTCPGYTPTVNPYLSNFDLSGCCRANGTCGYWETFLSLGCVEPGIYGQVPGAPCQP